jgi:RimJ/RimL family protein N-acetyltransferase
VYAVKQEQILSKIWRLKHSEFGKSKIAGIFNNAPYELLTLTADCVHKKDIMELLSKWREENEKWFCSQFSVTVDRTTKWFENKVIASPDRLLFLIRVGRYYVGHIGFFRFDFIKCVCEIDNIVRGETNYPGIMEDAVKNMMSWGVRELGLKGYKLKVLSDNDKAIRFYEKIGFILVSQIPLKKQIKNDGVEWVEDLNGDSTDGRFYNVMETA